MTERGKIRNKDFKRQIFDMSGLQFGKITPTDIDGFMDFGNKLFVFFESKHGSSKMSYGQRLALERLVDACHSPPQRTAVCFVLSHDGKSEEIYVSELRIVQYRHNGKWQDPIDKEAKMIDGVKFFYDKFVRNG